MGGVIIKLIICGNGLDIHVGLNTSYRAYRDYLVNKKIYEGESAISIIEKSDFFIPRDKDCWTDLENALTFDYRKYITQYIDAFDRDIDVNNYETSIAQMNSAKQFFKNNPQDIARDFTTSPNPAYQTPLSILSFLTFAIFAFGGLEVLGGLVDQTENAETTFPKGLTISAIVIAVGYAIGIFACGMFTNWNDVLSLDTVNMANVAYVLMRNLGYELGMTFGMRQASAITLGLWVARFVGFSMFLALTGAFFTLTYSPLKTLIEGSPKKLWPGKFAEIKDGMPVNAMWIQAIIAILIILVVSFGGSNGQAFFALLVLMTNVAMTIPYIFLSGAFPVFKKKQLSGEVEKPFMVYKSYGMALTASIIVSFVVGFANVFSIIEPAINGRITDTVFMIAGPVIFSIIAFILYYLYEKK